MSSGPVVRAWLIRGRVQGVGFRWHAVQKARELGLLGRVWNRRDGSVELHASGPTASLESLERWLAHGPEAASVERVEVVPAGPAATEPGFKALL